MSSNKRQMPSKRRNPELMPTAFIASSALSTWHLNGVGANSGLVFRPIIIWYTFNTMENKKDNFV